MENSNEFLVLREQEEIGKRLLQNLKLNKKKMTKMMKIQKINNNKIKL